MSTRPAQTSTPTSTDELVQTHLALADAIARRYVGRGEPLEDLRQCGALGLVLAAQRWDPGRGITFGAYATPVVADEIRRHLRDHGRLIRLPRRVWESAGRCRGAIHELTHRLGRAPTIDEVARWVGLDSAAVIEALDASAWPAPLEDLEGTAEGASSAPADSGRGNTGRTEAIRQLSPGQRRLLELVAFDHQSQRQIASLYGVSQTQISRALAATVRDVRRALDQGAPDNARRLAG